MSYITDAMLDEAIRLHQQGITWEGAAMRLHASRQGLLLALGRRSGVDTGRPSHAPRAAALRAAGLTWTAIAASVGYRSGPVACRVVHRYYARRGQTVPATPPKHRPVQRRIACACGCGQVRWALDARGTSRRYLPHHAYGLHGRSPRCLSR